MRLALLCFTACGSQLCGRLLKELALKGHDCRGWAPEKFINMQDEKAGMFPLRESLFDWTESQFCSWDGILFVGAAGIAVRAIAPHVKSKWEDPAVVVMDELGKFVIPLLSGHIGGANHLARQIADLTGAIPVITTATDLHGKFAVDVFAKEQNLFISDMDSAKKISADILDGIPVGFYSDFPIDGELPEGFTAKEIGRRNLWITISTGRFMMENSDVLRLIPRLVTLGIGCRKGISEISVREVVHNALLDSHIDPRSIARVASIDLKKEEAGIIDFAGSIGAEYVTFSAEELSSVEGEFAGSAFVAKTAGVANVCERAAVLGSHNGRLIIRKQADCGVTVAAAVMKWKVKL